MPPARFQEDYFPQHVAPQQPWPASCRASLDSFTEAPQQSLASAQQAAPAWQHAWAPPQHDFARAQQSLAWEQHPSLAGAAQQAASFEQHASFRPQQPASFSPAAPRPPATRPPTRTNAPSSFTNMIFSGMGTLSESNLQTAHHGTHRGRNVPTVARGYGD
jgi:hypothetical protein